MKKEMLKSIGQAWVEKKHGMKNRVKKEHLKKKKARRNKK